MAGIEPKDIILSVNGQKVGTTRELTGLIADTGVGDTAKIEVWRDGKIKTFVVKIAKREDEKVASMDQQKERHDELGIRVADLTPELAQRYNLKNDQGVIVVAVEADSKAEEAGIRPRDIIKEVNHKNIATVSDLNKAIDDIKDGEAIEMFIWRINRGFLVIKMEK